MNKIVVAVSVVLNGILIISLTGVIPFFLFLSLFVNITLIWYVFSLFRKNQEMTDDIEGIYSLVDKFEEHLENVHSLEMFYGDETLKGLITHSRQLINNLHDYIYENSIDLEEPAPEETSEEDPSFDRQPRIEDEETPQI